MKNSLLIALLCLLGHFATAGTNYYVATTGSDANNGLTLGTPFQTVTHAATVAIHGDTINVLAGTYQNATYGTWDIWKTEQTIKINNKNSTSGEYLVIRPYNQGHVTLKGDGDFIFQIRNSSYIRVEGFEIEGEVDRIPLDSALKYQFVYHDNLLGIDTFRVPFGTPPQVVDTMTFPVLSDIDRPTTLNNIGLLVQGSHHIDIVRNHIHHNTGTGLRFFECDYVQCLENVLHDNSRRSSIGNHGLVFHSSQSIDNADSCKILIARNLVYENYNEIYSWSELKTVITPHIDEGKGISMQKNSVANGWIHGKIRIENNIAHHNGFSGIHINDGIRMAIVNNTAYQNAWSFEGMGNNLGISVQDGDSIEIHNNISVAPAAGFALSAGNTTHLSVSHNLVDGVIDADIDAVDFNTLFANPQFVDTLDFHLQSSSMAVNAAWDSVAPLGDYYAVTRDSNPDIGATEYVMVTALQGPQSSESLAAHPNPFTDKIWVLCAPGTPLSVYSIDGRRRLEMAGIEAHAGYQVLHLENLPAGMYLLKGNGKAIKILKVRP